MRHRTGTTWLLTCVVAMLHSPTDLAHAHPVTDVAPERPTPSAAPAAAEADEGGEGSLPDYSGDWRTREYLSGDWGGSRGRVAEKGFTFDIGWTQIGQSVVSGGRRRDGDYGGNLDILMNVDFERMGLCPSGTLSVRAESRYGDAVNDGTGAFTPVNIRGYFPLTDPIDEPIPIVITELACTLSFCGKLDVTVGKMITAWGDPTEFAGGEGRTQFMNSNFIYNAASSQTAPYSTLGAAVDWYPTPKVTVSSALFATTDSSTTTGFADLDDGLTWWTQLETRYRLGGLPGGLNAGFQYAFDNEFTRIGGRLTLIPDGGVSVETVSDSWAVFFGGWQYLLTLDPSSPSDEVDASDGRVDLRGLGLFARLGFADPDANPVKWSASAGVGGRGLVPGRCSDTFGVGYYYTDVQSPRAFSVLALPSSGQGFEAFYNVALTPAVGLTLDVQWVEGGLGGADAATVLGLRLDITF
jgi:porin